MKYLFIIQQFAEGAAPAGGTGAQGTATATATSEASEGTAKAEGKGAANSRKNKPDLSNVIYGKPPASETTETKAKESSSESAETQVKRQTLAELLESDPELKKEYETSVKTQVSERTKAHLDRRLKNADISEANLEGMRPMFEILAQHYKLDPKDTAAIVKAVSEDDSYFKRASFEKGTNAKSERESFLKDRENFEILRENRKLKDEAEARRKADEQANNRKELFASWNREIPEVKKLYPSFDMDIEMKNPEFREMALQGKLKEGYEKVHRAEIDAAMMQYAHKQAEEKIANNVATGRSRPLEGAMSRDASPVYKSDPSTFTKEDINEVKRRARSGERIIF